MKEVNSESNSNYREENENSRTVEFFPDTMSELESPVDEDVKRISNNILKQWSDTGGELKQSNSHIRYSKDYDFCRVDWIIFDTNIELTKRFNDQLDELLNQKIIHDSDTTHSVGDISWQIEDEPVRNGLSKVKKGEILVELELVFRSFFEDSPYLNQNTEPIKSFKLDPIIARHNGLYEILHSEGFHRAKTYCLIYYKSEQLMLKHRFNNEYELEKDSFTKKNIFKWKTIGTPTNQYLDILNKHTNEVKNPLRSYLEIDTWLNFKLKNIDGVDYISFEYSTKEVKLKPNDSIYFLLDNEDVIEFKLPDNFATVEPRLVKSVDVPITNDELSKLSECNLEKVRIHEVGRNRKLDISVSDYILEWDVNKKYRQFVIRNYFSDHLRYAPQVVENYNPLRKDSTEDVNKEEISCFVYLMEDLSNNFYKIGISNDPSYRERTLQSEKPTIELIAAKEFPSRTIANSIEKALHNTYSSKNIRGEWFDIDEKEVQQIKKTLE